MSRKKISIKPAIDIRKDIEQNIDQWVKVGSSGTPINSDISDKSQDVEQQENNKESLYRLSLDIPEFLHRRIKKGCAAEGCSMKEKITKLLLDAFPEK